MHMAYAAYIFWCRAFIFLVLAFLVDVVMLMLGIVGMYGMRMLDVEYDVMNSSRGRIILSRQFKRLSECALHTK